MLCDICWSIEYDDLVQEPDDSGYAGFPHHTSFSALASCKDCDFCAAVRDAVATDDQLLAGQQEWKEHPIYLRIFPSSTAIDENDKSNLLVYCTPNVENGRNQKTLVIFGLFMQRTLEEWESGKVDSTSPAARLIGARPVSEFSNADDCFRLASSWLDQCVGKSRGLNSNVSCHGSVNATTALVTEPLVGSERFIPHRTIDVGPADGTCEPRLSCHDNKSLEKDLSWFTLSHCWGGSAPLTTTLSTIEQWKQGIPLNKMPATFRDAVIITRRLGIRHLWIDSLCIIQDSKEDWKREAAQMGEVYKCGLLNIAANTGSGCHDGIFTKRQALCRPAKLPLNSKKLKISSHIYTRLGRWDNFKPGILGRESTLTSRGWVLQESVLSPRTLHYAKQQMFWECHHVTFAEGNIYPVAEQGTSHWLSAHQWVSNKMVLPATMIQQSLAQVTPEQDPKKRTEIYNSWLQLIKNYTKRHLTFTTDIFAALEGVAAIFRAQLGDRYLSGLFDGDLLSSLLWHPIDPGSAQRRSLLTAPSWSWASIIGAVAFEIEVNSNMVAPQLVGSLTAKVIEAKTFLPNKHIAPAHYFTDVSGGLLVLEGQLLEQIDDLGDLCYVRKGAEVPYVHSSERVPHVLAYKKGKRYFDLEVDAVVYPEQSLAIMHIGIWEWWWRGLPGAGTSWFNRRFAGLLLRATDETRTTYQRIGIVTMEVRFHNVYEDSTIQEEDEEFLKARWKRRTVSIV